MSYIEDIKSKGNAANPYFCLMGIEAGDFGGGRAELSMKVRGDMLNGAGWLQGGVYVSLADEAMALAIFTVLEEGKGIATVSESTDYYKGLKSGILTAKAKIIKKTRKLIFAESITCSEDGSTVYSRTSASFLITG
ncbi:PaaI family thioesterase [Methanoplanus endosymbiosus]|uniref:PaaI family thioesterase n=1 Tax=Methanoplanus endosymbiosus TaxID=33865 RepID=A0A9E7PQG6_9EURY|nr:PaaI family thioesterase [Methanoplanus endosymbiosus]UUX91642.1 PaaI family thioesterase [Methanoplanus endosymbiosus]